MAYNLSIEKKVTAVSMLAEGNSIRSIERMTEVHRDTIMTIFVPHKEAPAVTASSATPPQSVTVTQYIAPRFQLVPCTVRDLSSVEALSAQTIFKIDTQTGLTWEYMRYNHKPFWLVITN